LDLHESGTIGQALKRTSTVTGFKYFNFTLEYLKKSSEPLHAKNESNLLLVQITHRILSSFWLVHFYLMKKSAKVLLYFGLDCRMLEFFIREP
jgi:hypothetical protein